MAEHGLRAANQHGRHPASVAADVRPPDRIHAPHEQVQAPGCEPVLDGMPAQAEIQELSARYDPVLAPRKPPYLR